MMTESLNMGTTGRDDLNALHFISLETNGGLSPLPNLHATDGKEACDFDVAHINHFVNGESSSCTPGSATLNIPLDSEDEHPILPAVNLDEFAKGTEDDGDREDTIPSVEDILSCKATSLADNDVVASACDAVLDDNTVLLKDDLISCGGGNTYGELDDENEMAHLLLDAPITDAACMHKKGDGVDHAQGEQPHRIEEHGGYNDDAGAVVNPDIQDVSNMVSYIYSQQALSVSESAAVMNTLTSGASSEQLKKWCTKLDVKQLCTLFNVQHNELNCNKFSQLFERGWTFVGDVQAPTQSQPVETVTPASTTAAPPAATPAAPLAATPADACSPPLVSAAPDVSEARGQSATPPPATREANGVVTESDDIEDLLTLSACAHDEDAAHKQALSSCVRITDGSEAAAHSGTDAEELLHSDTLLLVQEYERKHEADDGMLELLDVSDSNARLRAMVHMDDELAPLHDGEALHATAVVATPTPRAAQAGTGDDELGWDMRRAWAFTSASVTPTAGTAPTAAAGAAPGVGRRRASSHKRKACGGSLDVSDEELLRTRPKKKRRAAKFDKPVPSRFCHVCSRTPKNVRLAVCARIRQGTCRKVICEKCFERYGYGCFERASRLDAGWLCPHCRDDCPDRAQCRTYQRINDRLRVSRLRQEGAKRAATAVGALDGDGGADGAATTAPRARKRARRQQQRREQPVPEVRALGRV